MTLWERIAWIASYLAPVFWCGALLTLGVFVVWPSVGEALGGGRLHAWLFSLLALAAAAHLLVFVHGTTTQAFTRDQKAELRFKLGLGGRYGHWRRLMRHHERTWYKGHSHSAGRPRFD